MKTTPFTEKHIALGAKMHEFAGYNMPIEYSGIIDEHLTVCHSVGLARNPFADERSCAVSLASG
jgi:aminomethyltransferase